MAAHGVQRRNAGGRGSPGLRPGCGTVKTPPPFRPAEPYGNRCRRNSAETVRKRHGGSTRHDAEAVRGTARKQHGVRQGSSTGYGRETAGR
ncbi:MAG: hypothetical protein BHW17_04450 [Dorea sp. 42_8]|nr:MAG: hypothetical protein BHW17_04450 [Dorea sp. 42_8]